MRRSPAPKAPGAWLCWAAPAAGYPGVLQTFRLGYTPCLVEPRSEVAVDEGLRVRRGTDPRCGVSAAVCAGAPLPLRRGVLRGWFLGTLRLPTCHKTGGLGFRRLARLSLGPPSGPTFRRWRAFPEPALSLACLEPVEGLAEGPKGKARRSRRKNSLYVAGCGFVLPSQEVTTLYHPGTGQHLQSPRSTRVSGLPSA
jgi:hypothetical protein